MTVTLHIGLHKTGSTYLQHSFSGNRDVLAEHGWDYPEVGLWEHGHHALADAYRSEDERIFRENSQAFRQFLASSDDKVLISSERFEGLRTSPDRLKQLAKDLGNCTVQVVVFLRRRSDAIYSRWQQRLKYGFSESFPEFALRETLRGARSHILDFSAAVDAYAGVFGDHAIRLVAYSTLVEKGENLLDVFAREILELPDNCLNGVAGTLNPALSPLCAELIRLAHNELKIENRRVRAEFSQRFAEWLTGDGADILNRQAGELGEYERSINLAPIDRTFAARDRKLLERFGDHAVGLHAPDCFFPPRKRSIQTYALLPARPGQNALLNELLQHARTIAAEAESAE